MTYQPFAYNGFGKGLNLRDKPDAVDQQECIDAADVLFTERGAIVTRPGYEQRVATGNVGMFSFRNSSGLERLLTIEGTTLKAYTTGGSSVTLSSLTSGVGMSWARIGTPGNEYVYGSNGTDVRRFNGTSFSSPSGMPKANSFCVQSVSNRLVAAGFNGATDGPASSTSSPSHVYFSDPGAPETWDTGNLVQLTPGDGEKITGCVAWRELVIVFKQTKFFVFYGNSVDAAGDPIFNYRTVDTGAGLAARFGVAVGIDGAYFVGADGLYRTDGGPPTRVSDPVEPLWSGQSTGFYTGGVIGTVEDCCVTAFDQRILMTFDTEHGQRVLVFDPLAKWFSLYTLPAESVHGAFGSLWFGGSVGLCEHGLGIADDDGIPIEAFWRSGWADFGSPDIKVLRASKCWGAGSCFAAVAKDFQKDPGILEPLVFGGGDEPQWDLEEWNESFWAEPTGLAPDQRRRSVRGTTFSTLFQGDAPWAVHRVDHLVRQVRQPGIEK